MIAFRTVLDPACIILDLDAECKESVLRSLIDRFAAMKYTFSPEELLEAVLRREALAATGLEAGCAIPHAQSDSMPKTRLAFARLKNPIDFGASDHVPAALVFLLAGPKSAAGTHLQLLSKLARLLQDDAFRIAVSAANDPTALAGLFYAKDD